jgi:hypothetical protein
MTRIDTTTVSAFSKSQAERVRAIGKNMTEKKDANFSITQYFLTRILYRVARFGHDQFALKGGMLHYMREGLAGSRPTSDIDLHAHDESIAETIEFCIKQILTATLYDADAVDGVLDDGINIVSVEAEGLAHSGGEGKRFNIRGSVGEVQVVVKIDVGFGGTKPGDLIEKDIPLIAKNVPTAGMLCYPDWYVVAEKLHAIQTHGKDNTRVRDYWDLRKFKRMIEAGTLDRQAVVDAIVFTYKDRSSDIDASPIGLTGIFADEFREKTWRNWHQGKNWRQEGTLEECVMEIQDLYHGLLWEARLKALAESEEAIYRSAFRPR